MKSNNFKKEILFSFLFLFGLSQVACNGNGSSLNNNGVINAHNINSGSNIGVLPDGDVVYSSRIDYTAYSDGGTSGSISLASDINKVASNHSVKFVIRSENKRSNRYPIVKTHNENCQLSNRPCQIDFISNSAPQGEYLVYPIITKTPSNKTNNSITRLSPIVFTIVNKNDNSPAPGNLTINFTKILFNNNGLYFLGAVTLSNSENVPFITATLSKINNNIVISPSGTFNLSNTNNIMPIEVFVPNGTTNAGIYLNAKSSLGYSYPSIERKLRTGNLTISTAASALLVSESTNATITLTGAESMVHNLPVTVYSPDVGISINPKYCIINNSTKKNSCQVTISGISASSHKIRIFAIASQDAQMSAVQIIKVSSLAVAVNNQVYMNGSLTIPVPDGNSIKNMTFDTFGNLFVLTSGGNIYLDISTYYPKTPWFPVGSSQNIPNQSAQFLDVAGGYLLAGVGMCGNRDQYLGVYFANINNISKLYKSNKWNLYTNNCIHYGGSLVSLISDDEFNVYALSTLGHGKRNIVSAAKSSDYPSWELFCNGLSDVRLNRMIVSYDNASMSDVTLSAIDTSGPHHIYSCQQQSSWSDGGTVLNGNTPLAANERLTTIVRGEDLFNQFGYGGGEVPIIGTSNGNVIEVEGSNYASLGKSPDNSGIQDLSSNQGSERLFASTTAGNTYIITLDSSNGGMSFYVTWTKLNVPYTNLIKTFP